MLFSARKIVVEQNPDTLIASAGASFGVIGEQLNTLACHGIAEFAKSASMIL